MDKTDKLKKYGFDLDAYKKAKKYEREGLILDIVSSVFSLAVILVFIFFGTKPLYDFLQNNLGNVWAVRATYIASFSLGFFLLDLPTDWWSFRIEHRYNLSNQDGKSWASDQVKGLLISLVISLIGFSLLFWVIEVSQIWWLWAWLVFTFISIFLGFISPTLLMPLFYDFEPVEDESLKNSLEKLARRAGLEVLGVFNMKASEKTKKAIGALTGIGSSRRIILSDTMLENYSEEEIEAVIAHEMGHHKYHDIWILLSVQSLISLAGFFLIATFFDPLLSYFGLGHNISALPLVLVLMGLFMFVLSPVKNWISRFRERVADGFSLNLVEKPEALGEALVKLTQQNLGNPAPSNLVEMIFHDHPSGLKRVERAFNYDN